VKKSVTGGIHSAEYSHYPTKEARASNETRALAEEILCLNNKKGFDCRIQAFPATFSTASVLFTVQNKAIQNSQLIPFFLIEVKSAKG
jgi:hypothetical protein